MLVNTYLQYTVGGELICPSLKPAKHIGVHVHVYCSFTKIEH